MTNNEVVGAVYKPDPPVALWFLSPFDLNTARRSLAGNGQVRRAYPDRAFQGNRPADSEHYDAGTGSLHRTAQTARP